MRLSSFETIITEQVRVISEATLSVFHSLFKLTFIYIVHCKHIIQIGEGGMHVTTPSCNLPLELVFLG
jgi:hypothetical protein